MYVYCIVVNKRCSMWETENKFWPWKTFSHTGCILAALLLQRDSKKCPHIWSSCLYFE